ncbi:glycosyltransferase family 4 protein [Sphingobium sp. KCTC 72723]|uniref:glycosyltransferase family 4 protein n=1 Tax=Sphingobium sp. KCTC 72723 TaxID=2733867 RepID=UPI00165D53DF|nr:glycosyltransferase family 4 protein [Sphingobium sp. KCTC 72723]
MRTDPARLKIFCIASFMNTAGAQEALVRVSKQLRARGHDAPVRFIYRDKPAFVDDPKVQVIRQTRDLSALGYLLAFLGLLAQLRKERPDAVLCFMPLGTVMGCFAAALAGIPVRIASQRAPGPTFGTAMRILDRIWGSTSLYTRITCVSQAVSDSFDSYAHAYRKKMCVIHNGIDWKPSPLSKAQARARFNLPAETLLFFAAGRMSYQKYYAFLLERLRDVPDMHLVIAGDGDDRPALEAFIESHGLAPRVHLLGGVSHADVVHLYAAADVFIQTSRYEGQSNATLEAMHAGLPIITSDISMQRETLCPVDGECVAKLVSLDDPTGWNSAIQQLISSPEERQSLGRDAKAYVEARFGLKAMIDGFENILLEECK